MSGVADQDGSGIVQVRQANGATVVDLAGEVDMRSTPQLHERLVKICERQPPNLIINLAQVGYLDSSGLGTLVEALRRVRGYGGKLALCGVQQQVRGLFEITRLDQYFTIHDTEAEALAG